MQNFKDKLNKIIDENRGSTNLFRKIYKDQELYQWIIDTTHNISNLESFAEKIYCASKDFNPYCNISNKKLSWKNVEDGYGFCSKRKECTCRSKSTSEKLSKTLAKQKLDSLFDESKKGYELTELQEIITKNHSKHFARQLRKKSYLVSWIYEQTKQYKTKNIGAIHVKCWSYS